MGVVTGVNADVWATASPSLNTTNEACTDSGDHIHYTANTHIMWDDTQTLTVQCSPNGSSSWVTVTDYIFQWAIGRVVFNTARVVSTNNFVRISTGYYFNSTQVDAANKWAISIKGKTGNTTPFQASGAWEQNTALTKGATGTLEAWRNDARLYNELVATNNLIMLQLYIDKANNVRWQFACRFTGVDATSDASAVQSQKVTFETKYDVFYLTT